MSSSRTNAASARSKTAKPEHQSTAGPSPHRRRNCRRAAATHRARAGSAGSARGSKWQHLPVGAGLEPCIDLHLTAVRHRGLVQVGLGGPHGVRLTREEPGTFGRVPGRSRGAIGADVHACDACPSFWGSQSSDLFLRPRNLLGKRPVIDSTIHSVPPQ